MIPLRDNVGARRLSPINTLLIALNLGVFAYQLKLGAGAGELIAKFGMIPARIAALTALPALSGFSSAWAWSAALIAITLVTSLFLHGGLLHVGGNMLYLFIFGPAVEARFGMARYLGFYLAGGVMAGLAMVWMAPASQVVVIGASGAIAAVLGAYFVLYPRARLLTLLPLLILIEFIEIPALLYLLLWFGLQLYAALRSDPGLGMAGAVAWWAHVGGFLFGLAAAPMLAHAARSVRRPRPA